MPAAWTRRTKRTRQRPTEPARLDLRLPVREPEQRDAPEAKREDDSASHPRGVAVVDFYI